MGVINEVMAINIAGLIRWKDLVSQVFGIYSVEYRVLGLVGDFSPSDLATPCAYHFYSRGQI